jgi:hypothetical protein
MTPEHKAALAICDELIDLLEKRAEAGSEISLKAALFTLVITIANFAKAEEVTAFVCQRLPPGTRGTRACRLEGAEALAFSGKTKRME